MELIPKEEVEFINKWLTEFVLPALTSDKKQPTVHGKGRKFRRWLRNKGKKNVI